MTRFFGTFYSSQLKPKELIHPICIQYKVQKYSELEESMKAELDFFMPKNFEKNQFMYQRKAVASKANGKYYAGYIYIHSN